MNHSKRRDVPSPPTPAELFREIPESNRQRSNWAALPTFLLDYSGYLLGIAAACVVPTWWGKLLCCGLAAISMGGLFIIGHDAGHSSFVPSRKLNRILARLAFFPAYIPLTTWRYNHNVLHHRFLRVRNHDFVWQPWTLEQYQSQSPLRRAYYRFMRTPLGLPLYWTIHNWVPRYLLACPEVREREGAEFRRDRAYVFAFVGVVYAALYGVTQAAAASGIGWFEPVGPLGIFVLALVVPYVSWAFLMGFVDLIQHTHPRAVWFDKPEDWNYAIANLRSSTHIILPFGLNHVWHHILEHTAHHVDPRVPLYKLHHAQQHLERAFPDDVIVERLTPKLLWTLYRKCRLYDFQNQQWLDYDGTATAPAQRPQLEARHRPVVVFNMQPAPSFRVGVVS